MDKMELKHQLGLPPDSDRSQAERIFSDHRFDPTLRTAVEALMNEFLNAPLALSEDIIGSLLWLAWKLELTGVVMPLAHFVSHGHEFQAIGRRTQGRILAAIVDLDVPLRASFWEEVGMRFPHMIHRAFRGLLRSSPEAAFKFLVRFPDDDLYADVVYDTLSCWGGTPFALEPSVEPCIRAAVEEYKSDMCKASDYVV